MTAPQVLYIDAYDSFSNNIISVLEQEINARVTSIKIDDARFVLNDDAFFGFLSGFDAVVAGPGPGHAANVKDVGLIARLWMLPEDHILPVLGVCLGFQSMCLAFGATVERLLEPRHGLLTPITHCGQDVFCDTGDVLATQYHSLAVRLGRRDVNGMGELWIPPDSCKHLLPLAWDLSDELNGPILMAAKHRRKPFWGVQYHPESICTNNEGRKLAQQWWREVCDRKNVKLKEPVPTVADDEEKERVDSGRTSEDLQGSKVQWQSLPLASNVDVVDLVELLHADCAGSEPILLESGTRCGKPVNPETGRFSMIGLPTAESTHVRYFSGRQCLQVEADGRALLDCHAIMPDVFHYVEQFMAARKAIGGPVDVPFWGGLIGYVSYETGLETIGVQPSAANEAHPDVCFVFVERSVVVDHTNGELYIQSLGDDDWIQSTAERLQKLAIRRGAVTPYSFSAHIIREPTREEYCSKVRECQSQLRAGESYELCLTDTTLIRSEEDPCSIYRRIRHLNAAPFSSFLNLPATSSSTGLSIASSSPERFLSWSRDGQCQFRPIKGTVKKTPDMTRKQAEDILRSPKEQAENLMIVDLIRHDLSGVNGVSKVRVPRLMSIEEYATVYQLVSVIAGVAENPISVLAASLPPGSMTGAPKKRSCELLREIEGGNARSRGIYSGVIGYLDVGGGGDFSVAIRTAFKWGDEGCWRVGAGGAVTVLSDADAEFEEMVTKRESVMGAFGLAS